MYQFATIDATPESTPELDPFDEQELDDLFARLEEGERDTEDE